MAARTQNTQVTLPSAMMTVGSSVIMTEVTYPYTPPLHFLMPGPVDLSYTSYRRSRMVDPIPRTS
jgi:hypothetical protein